MEKSRAPTTSWWPLSPCSRRSSAIQNGEQQNVNTIEEPMEDSNALSTSGINSNISENSSFIEHTKRPRKKSEDVEFQKHLVNILSECNKPADGIDGFLIYLGDILKRLPFKERRALQKAIFDLAYEAEERAGFTK
ncbi:PREDICTED: uncharacterized protein LOC105565466 isoform X2 [Vollenhovia emeryi]|uniref:uncharacterized protein LOC105565466 isoform X2 n=1 Tax=Vollenhovia emeryi TaxID=411798 RepID=UPI0005F3E44A|nr:PREDICTED: uncharacterized protein LOC105565466 isoform X2 [Vollenhovia emeryi]